MGGSVFRWKWSDQVYLMRVVGVMVLSMGGGFSVQGQEPGVEGFGCEYLVMERLNETITLVCSRNKNKDIARRLSTAEMGQQCDFSQEVITRASGWYLTPLDRATNLP